MWKNPIEETYIWLGAERVLTPGTVRTFGRLDPRGFVCVEDLTVSTDALDCEASPW